MIEWWLRPLRWIFAARPAWRELVGRALLRIGVRFYWLVALGFALVGAWNHFVSPIYPQLGSASFDWLMTHRLLGYPTDRDIVVVDIDERSLDAESEAIGRWPWPREVLARVAERIEAAGAQAIVFDILFADPDTLNPASDAAFNDYVARSRVTFFAATRLDPQNDGASDVTVDALGFATRDGAAPLPPARRATIALIPPRFQAIYDSTRTGMINVHPDGDDVVRWYPSYEALGGYRVPSLPYRMGQVLHWPPSEPARALLNWPAGPMPYERTSFSDALHAATVGEAGYFGRFAGKIVVIGATAPGLNDLKATPVSHLHPGVAVLATAIDNTKNGRFLNVLPGTWIWLIELALLAGACAMFVYTDRSMYVAKYGAIVIPVLLLLVSMTSISVGHVLVDLSVPAAIFLAYFAAASIFEANHRDYRTGSGVFAPFPQELKDSRLQVACVPRSCPAATIESWLREPGCDLKLWLPPKAGLGEPWLHQGWVLWRLRPPGEDREPATPPYRLAWQTTPVSPGRFPLAKAIVEAAAAMTPWPEERAP